jgi:hypothetical protein
MHVMVRSSWLRRRRDNLKDERGDRIWVVRGQNYFFLHAIILLLCLPMEGPGARENKAFRRGCCLIPTKNSKVLGPAAQMQAPPRPLNEVRQYRCDVFGGRSAHCREPRYVSHVTCGRLLTHFSEMDSGIPQPQPWK